jgi:hypothetical protein
MVSITMLLCFIGLGQTKDSRFTKLSLPLGVSVEVPKNWWLLNGDYNSSIETAAEAAMNLAGFPLPDGKKVNLFRANSMPRTTYAAIAINASDSELSVAELAAASDADIAALTKDFKEVMQSVFAEQKLKLLDYDPVRKVVINGHPALSITYRRSGPQGPVCVKQTRLVFGKKEIGLTLSYRESEAAIWKPIIGYIEKSLRVTEPKLRKGTMGNDGPATPRSNSASSGGVPSSVS